ncbi:MAG: 4-(cytidine 5'-diphospho)-2-C-methyl-D-erythritol kinase [Alphaproteobacteria bacterium]|nr:4-(cytidine 5'-diphospho)-2-C-methyl-D-erythritol kinase [Alphaproteobacteria bacterium]
MSAVDGALSVLAPAKLNLFLHVLGRRADGYHELDSLVAFLDLGDRVAAREAEGLSLECDGPFGASVPGDERNLVLKAAAALRRQAGVKRGAALRLTKVLPPASGLGGGSADAAATLRLLCRLWRIDWSAERLAALGLELGADLPACLFGRPVRVGGIGERLTPIGALPHWPAVLINPLTPLETKAVFAARIGRFGSGAGQMPPGSAGRIEWLGRQRNDLTESATRLRPEIGRILAELAAFEGCVLARMAGSGATCFGLFQSGGAARAAAIRLAAGRPEIWVACASLADS